MKREERAAWVAAMKDPEVRALWVAVNPSPEIRGPRLGPALTRALREDALWLAGKPVEYLSIYLWDGRSIVKRKTEGRDSGVRLHLYFSTGDTESFRQAPMKELGAVAIHNHPSATMFSLADLKFATRLDLRETRVVTEEWDGPYVYRALRPEKGWDRRILSIPSDEEDNWTPEVISKESWDRNRELLRLMDAGRVPAPVWQDIFVQNIASERARYFGIRLFKEPLRKKGRRP